MEPIKESQPTQTPIESKSKIPELPAGSKIVLEKIKIIGINLFKKFYANKKVFWPVAISFGLIFLLIIVGLLFGNGGKKPQPIPTIKPTPFIQATPIPSPKVPELQSAGDRLKEQRQKIDAWDPKQSELRPLNYNFDVRF